MQVLESYVVGAWKAGSGKLADLVDPTTGEVIARAGTGGIDMKAALAWLAGMPVVTKPATATALVAERVARILVDAKALPEGAIQILCGSAGDLLDHLRGQDVLAFTGSADTGYLLRSKERLLKNS